MPTLAFHTPPRFPRGFRCASRNCGLKPAAAKDLSLFASDVDAAAAAVFTRNQFPGAPIVLGRETKSDAAWRRPEVARLVRVQRTRRKTRDIGVGSKLIRRRLRAAHEEEWVPRRDA